MAGDSATFLVRLIDKVSGPGAKVGKSIQKIQRRFRSAEKEMLANASDSIKSAATIGVAITAGIGAGLVGAAVKFADFSQKMNLGFQSVAKHGASAEKLFDHVRNQSELLGLDVQTTSKQFLKLLALQFNPKMATDLIRMSADLQGLGTDAEGVDRVLSQLGQIQAKGKLQGEELIVLAENGISTQLVYDELGKTLGKTRDEILKMQQAGKLTSDIALPAILAAVAKKTGGPAGELGERMAGETLSGMAGRLKAQAQNLFIDLGKAVAPQLSAAFKPIAEGLGAFMKGDGGKNFIAGMVDGITGLIGAVQAAIPFIVEFGKGFIDGFGEAMPAIKEALGMLFKGFGGGATWMTTVRDFAKLLGNIAAFAAGTAVVLGGMLGVSIQIVTGFAQAAIAVWNGLISGIGAAVFAVSDFFANVAAKWGGWVQGAKDAAGNFVMGLVNGIKNGVGMVVEAAKGLGRSMLGGIKSALGIASPSKEMEFMGAMSALGFEQGFAANDNFDLMGKGPIAPGTRPQGGAFAGGGGGNVIRINISVDARGSSEGNDRERGREIGKGVREEIDAYFDELALSVG